MSEELKPCPFCGADVEMRVGEIRFWSGDFPIKYELRTSVWIFCYNCKFGTPERVIGIEVDPKTMLPNNSLQEDPNVKKFIAHWNRRAT
jgi:hypothetical protein